MVDPFTFIALAVYSPVSSFLVLGNSRMWTFPSDRTRHWSVLFSGRLFFSHNTFGCGIPTTTHSSLAIEFSGIIKAVLVHNHCPVFIDSCVSCLSLFLCNTFFLTLHTNNKWKTNYSSPKAVGVYFSYIIRPKAHFKDLLSNFLKSIWKDSPFYA